MLRNFGYYWVLYEGEWEVAEFVAWRGPFGDIKETNWCRIGELFEEYSDEDFECIHPVRIDFPDGLPNPPEYYRT